MKDMWGQHLTNGVPDPWQEDLLRAFGRGVPRMSVRAGHGVGKSAVAAWMVWLMLLTRFPQKTIVTAPSAPQLESVLFPEIVMWGRRLPQQLQDLFVFRKAAIYLAERESDSFLAARTARPEQPEAIAGVHSKHTLLICDEASGIPEAVYEAGAGSMADLNAQTLLIGNPVRGSGLFFDTHHELAHMWFTRCVSVFDSPRVSPDFAKDIAARYGEDSNAYRVRVLGEFPLADDDTIIPWDLIRSAEERDIVVPPTARPIWGLDVARFGRDTTVLVKRDALSLREVDSWNGQDTMETAGRVYHHWINTPDEQRPTRILVDVIGMGGGVVDRLRELGLPVRGINVQETKALFDPDTYQDLGTELWFKARAWLEGRGVKLPKAPPVKDHPIAMLYKELASVQYKYLSNGKLQRVPKDETRKLLRRSPDHADGFVLTFAEEAAAVSGLGGGRRGDWNKPLSRGLVRV